MEQRESVPGYSKHHCFSGSVKYFPLFSFQRIGVITSDLLNPLHERTQTCIIPRSSTGERKIGTTGSIEMELSEGAKDASESALLHARGFKSAMPGDQGQTSSNSYAQTHLPTTQLNRTGTNAFTATATRSPPACSPVSQGDNAASDTVPTMPPDAGAASMEVLANNRYTFPISYTSSTIHNSGSHYWCEMSDKSMSLSRVPWQNTGVTTLVYVNRLPFSLLSSSGTHRMQALAPQSNGSGTSLAGRMKEDLPAQPGLNFNLHQYPALRYTESSDFLSRTGAVMDQDGLKAPKCKVSTLGVGNSRPPGDLAPDRSDGLGKDPGLPDVAGKLRGVMDKNRIYEECFRKTLYGFVLLSLASALPVVEAYPGESRIDGAQRGCINLFWFIATPFLFAYWNRRTVSGALMATSCFIWMTTKADPAVPATAAWSIFAVWMLSATVFISDVAVGTDHGKLYMVLVLALTAYLMTLSPVVQMLKNEDAATLVAACASLAAFLVSLAFKRPRNRHQFRGPEDTV